MAVIERHRTWLQRLTGTGYPGGRKPAPERHRATYVSTEKTSLPGNTPVPNFGRPKSTGQFPMIAAAAAVMAAAAVATIFVTGTPVVGIGGRVGRTLVDLMPVIWGLLVLGGVLFARSLIRKVVRNAASTAWTTLRENAQPKSPWSSADRPASPDPSKAGTGSSKAPPNLLGTIVGFFITVWFVIPVWSTVLWNLGHARSGALSLLPMVLFAVWAWRRHGTRT
ncbi:MAG TPA: hypothetical protein PK970_00485 [Hyphomicrobiaceae bacterium]|nr:hypothetical protein [Hyphomicrobiaceae bacterium]